MRTLVRLLLTLSLGVAFSSPLPAADPPGGAKRVLLVTHSGGFVHNSVGTAEDILKEIGPRHGLTVTCWRLTNTEDPAIVGRMKKSGQSDPVEAYNAHFRGPSGKPVEKENMGRINRETLKNFDCVLFFTTGNPMTSAETKDLIEWVQAGGAFAGTHCATDTLYGDAAYGNLIGGYFRGHPPGIQKIRIHVEDPKHPAAAPFMNGMPYEDEIYVFRDAPYSREKVHVILSAEKGSFDPGKNLSRADNDYAISWSREEGKGRVFYTSLGHRREVWQDERFQKHLIAGLKWAMQQPAGEPKR